MARTGKKKGCRGEEGQRCAVAWEMLGKGEAKGEQNEWKNEKNMKARNNKNKKKIKRQIWITKQ